MRKILFLGTSTDGKIFASVEFKDDRLSINGVEGPTRNGNCKGSCGQIVMGFKEYDFRGYRTLDSITPAENWTPQLIRRFFDVWNRWHLNDMKAGTPAQEEFLRTHPINDAMNHYNEACKALADAGLNPDNGYKYGSKWLHEEVPQDVIAFLQSLPESPITPAWV